MRPPGRLRRALRALFDPPDPGRLEPGCEHGHELRFASIGADGFVWMVCTRCGLRFGRHPDDWGTDDDPPTAA